MNPFCVPFATRNMGSAMLAMDLVSYSALLLNIEEVQMLLCSPNDYQDLLYGPKNYSISTACVTSNLCILNAANHIIRGFRGEADLMLCGGSDTVIIPVGLEGFIACKALLQRNSDPAKASRPMDTIRDGFIIGEGAGVLLLEELEHALARRGAEIYAEFVSGSFTCDACHVTKPPHPEGVGVALCID